MIWMSAGIWRAWVCADGGQRIETMSWSDDAESKARQRARRVAILLVLAGAVMVEISLAVNGGSADGVSTT